MFTKRLSFVGIGLAAVAFASGCQPAASSGAPSVSAPASAPAGTSQGTTYLVSSMLGRNEVPGDKGRVGDPHGAATELIKISGSTVSYIVHWRGIAPPTEGHIHAGPVGVNGGVKVPLFMSPQSGNTAHGSVTVTDKTLLASLAADPGSFYANLHTAEFPAGAVRGQLHTVNLPANLQSPAIDVASVVRGSQIYACTKQADGTFAFTQHDVSALLEGGIKHSFVKPDAGPAQWVAPDGSAVTGTIVRKSANGAGNIPELALKATQTGAKQGRLAHTLFVLRLNTVHGTPPAGTCDPQRTPTAAVPYQADYLFIG